MSIIIKNKYYSNGKLKVTGFYKNNLRHNKWTYYYKNGKTHYEKRYNEGKLEGERISYFENGNINFRGYFRSNKKSGKWIYYDIKGNVIKEYNYK
tara:strand:+ start:518 stop:802 length:285 start_codon:yes stop_codon:yes gene_type:complete